MVGIDDLLVILVTSHTGVITTKTMAPVALKVHQTIKCNTRMAKNNKMQVGGGGEEEDSLHYMVESRSVSIKTQPHLYYYILMSK